MDERPIVVVSNRGPVSFHRDEGGELVAKRGAGGLVSGLTPLLRARGRLWVAAALSDDDRAAIAASPDPASAGSETPWRASEIDGIHSVLAAVDAADLGASYDLVCNRTLWYIHHHLYDLASQPVFDPAWFAAWDAYRRVNRAFADLVARLAPRGAAVMIQDYHLALMGPMLAERRDDLATAHFSHTPFAEPSMFAVLPDPVRRELLGAMAGHDACGFHTSRWRDAFDACCAAEGIDPPATFVAPLGPDRDDLAATKASAAAAAATDRLEQVLGDRLLIARSDRIELSKNLVRGFAAFDVLLETHPEWRNQVTFAASVYPSRESNPDYVAYREATEACVAEIDARWSTPDWTPILLDTTDDFPTSVATLARADVVLVNSIRDGLNLVAKEAMLLSDRDALLALSPGAGAWEELGSDAAAVHPYDITQTARVLHELLGTDPDERAAGGRRGRAAPGGRRPPVGLSDQLAALV